MNTTSASKQVTPAQFLEMALKARAEGQAQRCVQMVAALTQQKVFTPAVANLAFEREYAGDAAGAEAVLRFGLERTPDSAEFKARLAQVLLRAGTYAEGWALNESREIALTADVRGRPKLPFPEWKGEAVGSLLVLLEQGLGDQIQFARYLPVLKRRGIKVVHYCAPPLTRLLAAMDVELVPFPQPAPVCDAWVAMMSLPHILGTTVETIPPAPYLPGAKGGEGIGVMVAGAAGHSNNAARSLDAATAQAILDLPGAVNLAPEATGAKDFYDTARIIDGLAAVVCVDTAVGHLAGAMGKPCHVMLPHVADWRWLTGRTDSPWYGSMTLHRQATPGDWAPVLASVKAALGV